MGYNYNDLALHILSSSKDESSKCKTFYANILHKGLLVGNVTIKMALEDGYKHGYFKNQLSATALVTIHGVVGMEELYYRQYVNNALSINGGDAIKYYEHHILQNLEDALCKKYAEVLKLDLQGKTYSGSTYNKKPHKKMKVGYFNGGVNPAVNTYGQKVPKAPAEKVLRPDTVIDF